MTSPAPPAPPRRGEVYLVDFSPATGHEMTGIHPCVIVQNDLGNRHSGVTIVVAVTSSLRAATLPVGVLISAGEGGLAHDSVAHCGHLYTVDKQRLRRLLGSLSGARMAEIDRALIQSLDLP